MSSQAHFVVRRARICDLPALRALQLAALRGLGPEGPDEDEIADFIRHVSVIDLRLLSEGSHYVALSGDRIVACGGWSVGSASLEHDQRMGGLAARGRASLRCVYEHPEHAGASAPILAAIEHELSTAGILEALVVTTYGGMTYYGRLGYLPRSLLSFALPDGRQFQGVAMCRRIEIGLARAA